MDEWKKRTEIVKDETRAALQTVFDELNHGQQQKLLKDPKIKAIVDRYGVEVAADD